MGRSTVSGMVSKIAQVGTRFVTVPIVIAHLGLAGYGIWSIVMTTAAYMRFGSVGIKSAFQKYVAEATGTGDYETANKLLSTGCAIMAVLSVVGLIPIALFSKQLAGAAGVPGPFLSSAAGSISVLAIIMLLSNIGAVFEAIVMGGHRIDLARNLTTFFTIAEAGAILVLLHFGYGLFSMAAVMAASELGFVTCCYLVSRRIVQEIRLKLQYVTRAVLYELVRFAGSYQLVNILEVLYAAILPVTILRAFGADASGVYALVTRLVSAAVTLTDAFLLPVLSGGALLYASGSAEEMRRLICKSFKVTLGLTLLPLMLTAAFGTTIVFAWTGQVDPLFGISLRLVCVAALFQSLSLLELVLYRVTGRALMDNVRQALRIVILLGIAVFARKLGFTGVLWGLAVAELMGMLFMMLAITRAFHAFRVRSLLPDAVKLGAATAVITAVGVIALRVPIPTFGVGRSVAAVQLLMVSGGCLLAMWPALRLTKAVSGAEGRAILTAILGRRARFITERARLVETEQ